MRLLYIIALIFVLAVSCSSDKKITEPTVSIVGNWTGEITATFPGPVDEPITKTSGINFVFHSDGSYSFFWEPFVGDRGFGAGVYEIDHDSIFIYQMTENLNMEPYSIEGPFYFIVDDMTLTMSQVLNSDLWQTTHDIEMIPGQVIFFND